MQKPASILQREDDLLINTLKKLREKAGLSIKDMAQKIATPCQDIEQLEAGTKPLTVHTLRCYANSAGMTLSISLKRH